MYKTATYTGTIRAVGTEEGSINVTVINEDGSIQITDESVEELFRHLAEVESSKVQITIKVGE